MHDLFHVAYQILWYIWRRYFITLSFLLFSNLYLYAMYKDIDKDTTTTRLKEAN